MRITRCLENLSSGEKRAECVCVCRCVRVSISVGGCLTGCECAHSCLLLVVVFSGASVYTPACNVCMYQRHAISLPLLFLPPPPSSSYTHSHAHTHTRLTRMSRVCDLSVRCLLLEGVNTPALLVGVVHQMHDCCLSLCV